MTDEYYQIEKDGIVEDQTRGSHKKIWQKDLINILYFAFGVIFSFFAIVYTKAIINEWLDPPTVQLLDILQNFAVYILSIAFLVASYELFLDRQSKVSLTKHGLLVKYPMHKTKFLKWDKFYAACLCVPELGYSRVWEYEVICFVMNGEKTNMSGRLKTGNPFHMRRLICVSNTEELFNAAKKWCPVTIVDVRETMAYLKYR